MIEKIDLGFVNDLSELKNKACEVHFKYPTKLINEFYFSVNDSNILRLEIESILDQQLMSLSWSGQISKIKIKTVYLPDVGNVEFKN